jgi:hypothetical protein
VHWYRSGAIYEGEWRNGKRDGHGTFWTKDASGTRYIRMYRGSWKDNKYGVSTYITIPISHYSHTN